MTTTREVIVATYGRRIEELERNAILLPPELRDALLRVCALYVRTTEWTQQANDYPPDKLALIEQERLACEQVINAR